MIDASVFVDALVVAGPAGVAARAALSDHQVLPVPAVFPAEVTSALSALVRRREMSSARAASALDQLLAVRTVQFPFEPFGRRAWELRDNLTVYDAWYVALAEQLGLPLVTADSRLATAAGPRCSVVLASSFEPS